MKRLLDHVGVALVWRYACHSLMTGLALLNEPRPAPSVPDTLLALIPRVEWVHRWNYHLWLVCYLPPALWLWRRDRGGFLHFLYVGGLLSLVRGVCVPLTGLGPPHGSDVNVGVTDLGSAWLTLVNPFTTLFGDAAHVYLTKDMFFSGHTATTFLLWLYCRPHGRLGALALVAHGVVVTSLFFSHLHYTIDVVAAYAITWSVFELCRRRWPVAAPA